MRTALTGLLILGLATTSPLASADEQPRRQVNVQGQASRLVAPDQASLSITVEGRNKDAEQAMAKAGQHAQSVVITLARYTDKANIRALQTQVRSVVKGTTRSWRNDSGEPMEMLASRQIQVERLNIENLPEVMEALAKQPLTRIDQVEPKVSNASEIEDEVLLLAIDDAQARAQRVAQRLSVKLGLPISVHVQQQYAPQPKYAMRAMAVESVAADAGGGYSAAGENEIRAQVNIAFELEAP